MNVKYRMKWFEMIWFDMIHDILTNIGMHLLNISMTTYLLCFLINNAHAMMCIYIYTYPKQGCRIPVKSSTASFAAACWKIARLPCQGTCVGGMDHVCIQIWVHWPKYQSVSINKVAICCCVSILSTELSFTFFFPGKFDFLLLLLFVAISSPLSFSPASAHPHTSFSGLTLHPWHTCHGNYWSQHRYVRRCSQCDRPAGVSLQISRRSELWLPHGWR